MSSRTGKGPAVRSYRRRKAVLDLDLNRVPASESREQEGPSTQLGPQEVQAGQQPQAVQPAMIDVEAIDDDVVESSPRAFAEAKNNSRRNRGRTIVDVDLEEQSRVTSNNRNKRRRESPNQTIINCDLYINLEGSSSSMVTAIGSCGPNLRIPSYHEIRVPLLNKELEFTEELLKDHKEQWRKHGCSIMSDAWTDRKSRSIINFLVNSAAGTMFLKSVDASNVVKSGDLLFEMLDSIVEEVGEENVVQVISDNGSNYVSAGKKLEEKRPHLFWTPCAALCIDLMLEDIGKLSVIKKTIQRGVSLVGFIYGHTSTLSLMRQFTNKRELVRHAVTRFATSYLSLERLHQEKTNLRKMFTFEEWTKNKLYKEVKGKQATKVVLMPSFWKHVVFTLKVMAPLVRVLRLADGARKPAMGYIYEAIDRAKETITNSFSDPDKYKDVFAIIDKRWQCQLGRDLHAAAHLLNPEFFYSNSKLENDLKVNNGLYNCITRLVQSEEMQTKILMELPYYKSADGLFGSKFAVNRRKTLAPAQWWKMYGMGAPHLQPLAIKILSLTCSASGCERNWSVFEQKESVKKPPEPPKEPVFSCPICMGPLVEEMSTRCGHIFCKSCIKAAISAQGKCPTCRKKVTVKELIRVFLPSTS